MEAVLLPVGEEWYAVDVDAVQEVVAAPRATPLPDAPAGVSGVFNLRGEIIPLFDTALLLGLEPVGRAAFAAVVETALGLAALATSGLPEKRDLHDEGDEQERPGPGGGPAFRHGGRLVTMVDLEVLLGLDRPKPRVA